MVTDNFEKIWPEADACPCAGDDALRSHVLAAADETALALVMDAQGFNICSTMLPHYIGMVVAFALGYHAKMNDEHRASTPLLCQPGVLPKSDVVAATVRHMVAEAMTSVQGRC